MLYPPQCIGELEQALPPAGGFLTGADEGGSTAQTLPVVISYMHDYFVHVASKMEKLHQQVDELLNPACVYVLTVL